MLKDMRSVRERFPFYIEIPSDSPVRRALTGNGNEAHDEWRKSFDAPSHIQRANKIANSVGDMVSGITVIRPGHYSKDYRNRCDHYAFGEVQQEKWAQPGTEPPYELWDTPLDFLMDHGYTPAAAAHPGTIASYIDPTRSTDDKIRIAHFGITQQDGGVISKLGQGPVVRHPIDYVPTGFGNTVIFLQKTVA